MENLNKRIIETAHKITYIAKLHPDKKMAEMDETGQDIGIAGMFQTSPIEFNAGAWAAQDLGLIKVDEKTNEITVLETPEEWQFGELVDHLLVELPYTIGKLNENEADIQDDYLKLQWTAGFPDQDVEIALAECVAQKKLATYEVVNETEIKPNREQRRKGAEAKTLTDTYLFYTLPANIKKRWGEKQFLDQQRLQKEEA